MEQMIRDHIAGAALRAMFKETPPRERGPGPLILPFDGAYEADDGSYEPNDSELNYDSIDDQQALQQRIDGFQAQVAGSDSNPLLINLDVDINPQNANERDASGEPSKQAKSPQIGEASTVFFITEIVEKILVQVPVVDLILNDRQVCQQWKTIIEKSSFVQSHINRALACEDLITSRAECGRFLTLFLAPFAQYFLELFWRKLLRLYSEQKDQSLREETGQEWCPDAGFLDKLFGLYTSFLPLAIKISVFPYLGVDSDMSRGILLTKATNLDQRKVEARGCSLFEQKFGTYPPCKESLLPNILYIQCFKAYHRFLDKILDRKEIILLVEESRIARHHDTDFLNLWAVYKKAWAVFTDDVYGRDEILEETDRQGVIADERRGHVDVEKFAILFNMKNGGSVRLECDGGQYNILLHTNCRQAWDAL
ncbi:hypothetical protein TWF679_010139 [Orbilia oligospora]|uniref:F-box domain-containing protein n=1 Tax=Orbilia oligospora TaxID=2813651 RepID=A0A8H8V0X2_ORBOL|nr:hypothetical protein TWF679_010139 [Orbilia oligospora]